MLTVETVRRRIAEGSSVAELAAEHGLTCKSTARFMYTRCWPFLPSDAIVRAYIAGATVVDLSVRYKCSRGWIDRVLREAGVSKRSYGETMAMRWQAMSVSERERITSHAHAAVKGRRYSREELCRRAASRMRTWKPDRMSCYERQFVGSTMLELNPQFAVGPYNIDFKVAGCPLAVDIFGGNFHSFGKHAATFRERSEHIRDAGYAAVILWAPFDGACVDEVHRIVEVACGDEAVLREQYVVRRDSNSAPANGADLDYLTGVMRFEHDVRVIAHDTGAP